MAALRRHELARRRKAVGWTQESFAERLGIERSTVVRWEAGLTEPLAWMRPRMARALNVSIEALDGLLIQSQLDEGVDHQVGTAAVAQLRNQLHDFAPALHVSPVAHSTESNVFTQTTRSVGPDDVAVLHETTNAFRRLDNRFGGGHARTVVSTYLATEVEPVLRNGQFAPGHTRRAFFCASVELYQRTGWMAYDVSDHATGRAHLRRALELATEADDDTLCAEMLAAMSHQAAFRRNSDEAIDMALAARQVAARSGAPALRSESAALEAHGFALQGNGRDCIAALQRAEKAFLAITPENTPLWVRYFDEAYLAAKFAHALRDLGQPGEAERFARSSLSMSEGYDRGRLFNNALLASVLIDQGKIDEGVEHATIAVRMAARIRSARARCYLHEVSARLLRHPSHARVPALQQDITSLGTQIYPTGLGDSGSEHME